MAEINLERRRKSPLPWILALVAVALLAFFLMRTLGGGGDRTQGVAATDTSAAARPAPLDTTAPAGLPVVSTP